MPIRLAYFAGLALIIILILTSVYLQFYEGIIPCPLCSLQRLVFGLLGVLCLFGMLVARKAWGRWLTNSLTSITSICGMLLAGRQIWMQHNPIAGGSECGVSLQFMLQAFPLNQALLKIIFEGSTECTKRGWEFMHLNMAEWSFVWFTMFLLMALYLSLKEFKF